MEYLSVVLKKCLLCGALFITPLKKILKMGITRVSRGLIKQLVLADTATMLRAEQQLQAATSVDLSEASHADRDICLRQQQKGLCTVGF